VSAAFTHAMSTVALQTSKLKQFVAHASHELKTPLMMISSASDVLHKKGQTSSQLSTIKETTVSMKLLIDHLMMTMRQDIVDKKKVDIVPVIQHIIQEEQKLFQSSSLHLDISLPPALLLLTDHTSLESIVTNLLHNAYKYAVPDSIIEITVTDDELVMSNVYDGTHIPDMDLIREPFYRADESRTDGTSHGL